MDSQRILFVASVEGHLKHFHEPYLQMLCNMGYQMDTAASGENMISCLANHYDLPFRRSPLSIRNLTAYQGLRRLIERNNYTLIHCHTPVAAFLTRMAARNARKKGTKVLYTAHGFHFYEGASPLKNLIFLSAERYASRFTDCIITINREDYAALGKHHFKSGQAFLTHGVGIDLSRFSPIGPAERLRRRKKLILPVDAFVLIYPAEYSARKNQEVLLRAVALALKQCPSLLLLLPGDGAHRKKLEALARSLHIANSVRFLGFRTDIPELLSVADVSVAPSKQEGLPTHVIEAMASGLPCIASRIRGQVDLIEDGVNGLLYPTESPAALAEKILLLYNQPELRDQMGRNGLEKSRSYGLSETSREMADIYRKYLKQRLVQGEAAEQSQGNRCFGGI